ncbi:exonuclease [Bordetella phage CN1]|uniref:Exonuclease n=1 Tax=Bordetella phage CN1 TaxID=1916123 RepID=A0A2D0W9U9_9CAUD|nr:exonuclease [Bordetella phage CN1]APL99416.1 exonuclease [Bordetella phage CN1]
MSKEQMGRTISALNVLRFNPEGESKIG